MGEHKWARVCRPPAGLVRPLRTDSTGITGPTPGAARGKHWRRTSQGWYVPADTSLDVPEQRVLEQSVRLPDGAAVTGWAACRMHGAGLIDGLAPDGRTRIPVGLALGGANRRIQSDPSVRLSFERLAQSEVVSRQGVRVTIPLRAVFDAMREAGDLREAVVVVDMMVAAELVTLHDVRRYVAGRVGWRGVGQVRRALDLASEHSWSPQETRLRLVWRIDAGLPDPLPNCPVHGLDGSLLGTADLLDAEAGLVAEFDGADHRRVRRHARDIAKEDRFRRHGLEVARVTGLDLADVPLVVRRLQEARSRARFLPPAQRRWQARPMQGLSERRHDEELVRRMIEDLESQPLPDIRELRGY